MTEKEKAAKGLLYDANNDQSILEDGDRTRTLLYEYNTLHPEKKEEQKALLKKLLGKTGKEFILRPPFYCDYGYNIEIGEEFFANMNLVILDGAKVTIGNNVFIAPNVGLYTAGHPLDAERRNQGLEYALPITIGNSVWIGAQVAVLPGVTIGDNTVIGAGSVVNKDIPPNVLAAGNPCKVIREITEKDRDKHK